MNNQLKRNLGFTLIELMLSITIGLIIIAAVIGLYMAQKQIYNSSNSQAAIQNSDNAISALVIPIVRGAGFAGCGSVSAASAPLLVTLNTGAPNPLGNLNAVIGFVYGFEAAGTAPTNTFAIPTLDPANDSSAGDWTPTLDTSLVGDVEPGSDVLVVLGPVAGAAPTGLTAAIVKGSLAALAVQNASAFSAGQVAAISDCGKTIGAWTVTPLIPGVDSMQVLYGVGTAGTYAVNDYVTAAQVTDWTSVYAVRISLLIEGERQSTSGHAAAGSTFNLLGTTVTVPADGILRHTEEINVNLRNL